MTGIASLRNTNWVIVYTGKYKIQEAMAWRGSHQLHDCLRRSRATRSKSSHRLTLKELCIKFSLLNFRNVKRPKLARVMTPWVESDDTAPPMCAVGCAIAFCEREFPLCFWICWFWICAAALQVRLIFYIPALATHHLLWWCVWEEICCLFFACFVYVKSGL